MYPSPPSNRHQGASRVSLPSGHRLTAEQPTPQRLGRSRSVPLPQGKRPSASTTERLRSPSLRSLLEEESAPLPTRPLGSKGRWLVRGIVLTVIGAVLFFTWLQGGNTTAGQPPLPPTDPVPTPAMQQPHPSVTAAVQGSPQETAAAFLARYFRWSAQESDQEYQDTWRSLVVDGSVPDLVAASPRLTLDDGNDSQASNTLPSIPVSAISTQGAFARIALTWTIQVLSAGGELATYQDRYIQITLNLTHTTRGWLISSLGWSKR